MTRLHVSERVKAWTDQIRTQGFTALWERLTDTEREEFALFAEGFDEGFAMETEHHWQEAADRYKGLSEKFPAYADVAISRASHVISEKINRAIRFYNQGVQALEAKQYNKAMQFFGLALNVDSNMERAQYNLGMTHKLLYVADPVANKLEKIAAVDAFQKLLQLNPDHARARAQIDQLNRL